MTQHERLKYTLRWSGLLVAASATFWGIWYATHGSVPQEYLHWLDPQNRWHVSLWWSILAGPAAAYLALRIWAIPGVKQYFNAGYKIFPIVGGVFGGLITGLFIWVGHEKTFFGLYQPVLIMLPLMGWMGAPLSYNNNHLMRTRALAALFMGVIASGVTGMLAGIVNGGVVLVAGTLAASCGTVLPRAVRTIFRWLTPGGD